MSILLRVRFLFVTLISFSTLSFAQETLPLFKSIPKEATGQLAIKINELRQQEILKNKPDELILHLPFSTDQTLKLRLKKFHFLSDAYVVKTLPENRIMPITVSERVDYMGTIEHLENTFVVLTISDNEIKGYLSIAGKSYHLFKQDADLITSNYLLKEEELPKEQSTFSCQLEESIPRQQNTSLF